jgi:hypothetical protein
MGMKYIITENRMENMIKEFILKTYDVYGVEFSTKRVHLGSGPNEKGETMVEQKVIEIYIENFKNQKRFGEMKSIKTSLWDVLRDLFGIDLNSYGTEWSLKVYQLKREEV